MKYLTRTPKATGWPLFRLREKIMIQLVKWSYPLYLKGFKRGRPAWQTNRKLLLQYPEGSLGRRLGVFLQANDIDLIPKLENHDVFHVLLDYEPHVIAEAQMQFCLLGNGKRSPYVFGTAIIAMIAFPEFWASFKQAYHKGQNLRPVHRWYFEYLLDEPLVEMKAFISKQPSSYYKSIF